MPWENYNIDIKKIPFSSNSVWLWARLAIPRSLVCFFINVQYVYLILTEISFSSSYLVTLPLLYKTTIIWLIEHQVHIVFNCLLVQMHPYFWLQPFYVRSLLAFFTYVSFLIVTKKNWFKTKLWISCIYKNVCRFNLIAIGTLVFMNILYCFGGMMDARLIPVLLILMFACLCYIVI